MSVTQNTQSAKNAMVHQAIRQVLAIELALEEIASSSGDGIAATDVVRAMGWNDAQRGWSYFTRAVRRDPHFREGLARAGFMEERRGGHVRFVRMSKAN